MARPRACRATCSSRSSTPIGRRPTGRCATRSSTSRRSRHSGGDALGPGEGAGELVGGGAEPVGAGAEGGGGEELGGGGGGGGGGGTPSRAAMSSWIFVIPAGGSHSG